MSHAARFPKDRAAHVWEAGRVAVRIAACRDPGAHGATAPGPTVVAGAAVQGAKASRADARRPPSEGTSYVEA
jgi:hypothetical protein